MGKGRHWGMNMILNILHTYHHCHYYYYYYYIYHLYAGYLQLYIWTNPVSVVYSIAVCFTCNVISHVKMCFVLLHYNFPKYACSAQYGCFYGSSLISYFPSILLRYCVNDFGMVPVAPIITGITFAFIFHMCWISVVRSLYFRIFSASFGLLKLQHLLMYMFLFHYHKLWCPVCCSECFQLLIP